LGKNNRAKESRQAEAISRAELARRSDLADRTLKRLEENMHNVAPLTRSKIVKGFNTLEQKQREYTIEYLFPDS
jgi:transcriptional regulator with XRE-family HTH domain